MFPEIELNNLHLTNLQQFCRIESEGIQLDSKPSSFHKRFHEKMENSKKN